MSFRILGLKERQQVTNLLTDLYDNVYDYYVRVLRPYILSGIPIDQRLFETYHFLKELYLIHIYNDENIKLLEEGNKENNTEFGIEHAKDFRNIVAVHATANRIMLNLYDSAAMKITTVSMTSIEYFYKEVLKIKFTDITDIYQKFEVSSGHKYEIKDVNNAEINDYFSIVFNIEKDYVPENVIFEFLRKIYSFKNA